ncbi:MAG: hypothetical protein LCH56_05975 [Proteobacteria bacterium]|nr:hypothetical protein [Pseudomonadota bacterium]
MAEGDPQETEAKPAEPEAGSAGVGRSIAKKTRGGRRTRAPAPPPLPPAARTFLTAEDAASWFVSDLMEVSGFVRASMRHRSGYSHYRPILTKPDPWYFAGLVALEASKIIDLFPPAKADALLREVLVQADAAGARHEVRVSNVVLGVMGRLGMGQLLLHGKVPDYLIAKIMRILLGSAKTAVRLIPNKDAHEQVTSALKIGHPVWWRMFVRRFDVRLADEPVPKPKLIPLEDPNKDRGKAAAA